MMDETLDKLGAQDERVREVSVMVAKDGALAEEKLQEIAAALSKYMQRRRYTNDYVARQIDTSESYVSTFKNAKFGSLPAATAQELARLLNEWMELDNRRVSQQVDHALIHTVVARRAIQVALRACETSDMVIAHSPAGTGKTATLQELLKLIPGSMYVYITPDGVTKSGFLKALYEAVWQHRAPARPTLSQVIERLKYSNRLLMIDNADFLTPAAYPVLMSLHDVAQIPILIAGTYKLVEKLTHDADPLRGQMASRIGMRAELLSEQTAPTRRGRSGEWIKVSEIREIFERGRVRLHPSVAERLKSIANSEIGRLRRCERLVRYARVLAQKPSGTIVITDELLDQAILLVDGKAAVRRYESREVAEATA